MIAYKLFRIKGGQLFPLYVFPNEAFPLNQWIDAKEGERTSNGKVRSKIGPLAFRSGFHACEFPVALHIGGKTSPDLKRPDHRKADQVWCEVEFESLINYQDEADRSPKKCITDRVPLHGYYFFKTNPNAVCRWLIGGTMRINRILTDDEVAAVNATVGLQDLPRL